MFPDWIGTIQFLHQIALRQVRGSRGSRWWFICPTCVIAKKCGRKKINSICRSHTHQGLLLGGAFFARSCIYTAARTGTLYVPGAALRNRRSFFRHFASLLYVSFSDEVWLIVSRFADWCVHDTKTNLSPKWCYY